MNIFNRASPSSSTSPHSSQNPLKVSVNYTLDIPGGMPYFYNYDRPEAERQKKPDKSGTHVPKTVEMNNGRLYPGLTLDISSFELIRAPTAISRRDFENEQIVKDIYHKELEKMILRSTGCSFVKVMHTKVRTGAKTTGNYAHIIHSDSCPNQAEKVFLDIVPQQHPKCRKGRFLYINAWRNIANTPIVDNHLAMCDERSVIKPDDYVTTELHTLQGTSQLYHMSPRHSHLHKWYYFPKMTRDEVIIFKQWDSDYTKTSRVCFHTAFSDPLAPPNAPPRSSIEARMIAFFPDAKINTCPIHSGNGDDFLINKISSSMLHVSTFPEPVRNWICSLANSPETIAKTIIDDKQNHHGTKDYPAKRKAGLVKKLLESPMFIPNLKKGVQKCIDSGKYSSNPDFAVCKTIVASLSGVNNWPLLAKTWILTQINNPLVVAKVLVKDDKNHLGLKNAPLTRKKRLVGLLLSDQFGFANELKQCKNRIRIFS